MKIKINEFGELEIQRAGKFKRILCEKHISFFCCGDECVKFGDPEFSGGERVEYDDGTFGVSKKIVSIRLCNGDTLNCEQKDFKDERVKAVSK